MSSRCKLVLAGAGLVGQWHGAVILGLENEAELHAIVDPSPEGRAYAEKNGVSWYPSLSDMFSETQPDGIVLATPNQVHLDNALECIANECPVLIEKPIATNSEEAEQIVIAAQKQQVPVLVGHHRRHNPIVQNAKSLIDEGRLGRLTMVQSICWLRKPEDYFAQSWRRLSGAGPVMVNAIHDLDLMRHLCGEVSSIQAMSSNAVRGFETEDTAAVLMTFSSGAIGTLSVSDTVAAPWSWELTSGENPAYPQTDQSCYLIGGTKGSLSLPDARLWSHEGDAGWKDPVEIEEQERSDSDPLVNQIRHFMSVIAGASEPLVSGEEGLKSLALAEAILQSAASGEAVQLNNESSVGAARN